MDIVIEKINGLGLVQSKKIVKLPKARMLITIGNNQFLVSNISENPTVDKKTPDIPEDETNINEKLY